MEWSASLKTVVITALTAFTGALYGSAPLFGLDEFHQAAFETVVLAITVLMGAVVGVALAVNWMSKRRSEHLPSMVDNLLTGIIVLIAGVYVMAHYFGIGEFGIYDAILKSAALVILIVVGTMLGVRVSHQYGMLSIGDATNTSGDTRHTESITSAQISKMLYRIANATLVVVLVVVFTPFDPQEYLVTSDALFTTSATILGLGISGSALSTLGVNKDLIKSIAYTLIPFVVVQLVFMLSVLGSIVFPAELWVIITAILLMLLVFAIVANKIMSAEADGDTDASRRS